MMRNADCTLERMKSDEVRGTQTKRRALPAPVAAALLVTVRVVQQVGHGEERVAEDAGGDGPVLGVDEQHTLQQGHKLPAVGLLRLHVAAVGAQHHVHLADGGERDEVWNSGTLLAAQPVVGLTYLSSSPADMCDQSNIGVVGLT